MITVYACGTPNVLKVMLMLAETGLDFELKKVNVHEGEQFSPEFLALNPNNKVPVIVDPNGPGDAPITVFESGAILFYLAEKTGQFMPGCLDGRIHVMEWLMVQMSAIGPMFGQAVHFHFMAPPDNEYARSRFLTEVKRLYDVVETRLSQSPWLGGLEYSIADMATYPWIANYHYYDWTNIAISDYPHLAAWAEAVRKRDAYKQVFPIFKELAKETLAKVRHGDPDKVDHFFGRGRYART